MPTGLEIALAEAEARDKSKNKPARPQWKGVTQLRNENEALQAIVDEMKAKATASARQSAPATMKARPAASAPDLLDQYSAMSAGPGKILFLARHGIAIQQLAKARAMAAR